MTSAMTYDKPFRLRCSVQHYAWGKYGQHSLVGRLAGLKREAKSGDESVPYAELWIGAHEKAPATIISSISSGSDEISLRKVISDNPEQVLGGGVVQTFGPELPFLLKVLSVRTALSIQAHPTKEQAERLHQRDPKNYPDTNHKPEMAVALTPLSLLYGFRPLNEVQKNIESVEELRVMLTGAGKTLQEMYQQLMSSPAAIVAAQSKHLYQRLKRQRLRGQGNRSPEDQWILRLADQYPDGDVGLFCFYLMNYLTLQPGEAIYILPCTPHAYLEGDLVECMATSDNVIRGGLTEKFKDIPTLLQTLQFETTPPSLVVPESVVTESFQGKRYSPPIREFQLFILEAPSKEYQSSLPHGVEVVFCLEGEGLLWGSTWNQAVHAGDAFLVPAALGSYSMSLRHGRLVVACVR